jgi:3-deoxy-D-manno-octulosonic-acid transferase
VGEGLQARPVAHALRERHPAWQFAYTFFSPSAEGFAASVGAEITDYLPFDRASDADALLDALRPSILVFSKLDVWPVLVERAAARHVPVALISGTLAASSSRRGWWSRLLVHDAYAALSAVGAIDAEHGERMKSLGVAHEVLTVTGDTRFDQVWHRAQSVDLASPHLSRLASTRPTLVAGSTWPADEAVLLEAWSRVHGSSSSPRLIIAPHEPTVAHCGRIESWARERSMTLVRYTQVASGAPVDDADVMLVDTVGVLGELYALADMAFVGGGFHRAGLHSAIEPAAFGVPVVFGPHHDMSREAELLLAAGGAQTIRDAESLATLLRVWLADEARRKFEGAAARMVVERELGATARSVQLIEQVLQGSRLDGGTT